ncbi:hypothetical protein [Lacticaseibacillus thailandensis]|uniref:hypothetical protein n=1 Tax=Lacticaseibacillus thailandensis TaxID=381741 RepID=UPI0006D12D02|nr:hypothetical protein [Lacticaseibacillus thailandensis]
MLKKLAELSDFYVSISDPRKESIFSDQVVIRNLYVLNLLGAKTFYPLILVMIDRDDTFNEHDIGVVLFKVISFTVRNFTIGGLVANQYEKSFATIANNLYRGSINTVAEINHAISEQMTSDRQFANDILTASVKTERAAKYILSELAYSNEVEDIDLNDVKVLELNANVEDSDRIGNKFLLTKEENRKAKRSLRAKADTVAHAKFAETRSLAEKVNTIDSDGIDARQAAWAQMAVTVWAR